MSNRPRSMRFSRSSRIVDPSEMEPIPDTEEMAWKRKYRQSLNDVDLANKFAEFMPPDLRDNFLDHNKAEFETVLESRPQRTSALAGNNLPEGYMAAWQDLDLGHNSTTSSRRQSTMSRRQSKRFSAQLHPRTSTYIAALPPIPPEHAFSSTSTSTESERETEPETDIARYESKSSSRKSRRNSILKPVKSFVNLFRRSSQ